MEQYAVGIDLGGTNIKAALVHRGDGVLHQVSIPTHFALGPDQIVRQIADSIREITAVAPDGRVAGVGVGAPGVISWDRSTISYPPNIPGWRVVNLQAELHRLLDDQLPVLVENDANAAGLGSAFFGAGRAFDSFIMVTLGTGVGGAIIYQKKIFRGTTGAAGEIGHMSVDYEGPYALSGISGAIEAYIGQRFLTHHARHHLVNYPDSLVHKITGRDPSLLNPKVLHDAAVQGDAGAREILAWAGHKLGCVLGGVVNMLDIRKVVIGGGVSAAGDFILGPAEDTLLKFVIPGMRSGVQVARETLGNEVGMLGAARLVFEYLDEHTPHL